MLLPEFLLLQSLSQPKITVQYCTVIHDSYVRQALQIYLCTVPNVFFIVHIIMRMRANPNTNTAVVIIEKV